MEASGFLPFLQDENDMIDRAIIAITLIVLITGKVFICTKIIDIDNNVICEIFRIVVFAFQAWILYI